MYTLFLQVYEFPVATRVKTFNWLSLYSACAKCAQTTSCTACVVAQVKSVNRKNISKLLFILISVLFLLGFVQLSLFYNPPIFRYTKLQISLLLCKTGNCIPIDKKKNEKSLSWKLNLVHISFIPSIEHNTMFSYVDIIKLRRLSFFREFRAHDVDPHVDIKGLYFISTQYVLNGREGFWDLNVWWCYYVWKNDGQTPTFPSVIYFQINIIPGVYKFGNDQWQYLKSVNNSRNNFHLALDVPWNPEMSDHGVGS